MHSRSEPSPAASYRRDIAAAHIPLLRVSLPTGRPRMNTMWKSQRHEGVMGDKATVRHQYHATVRCGVPSDCYPTGHDGTTRQYTMCHLRQNPPLLRLAVIGHCMDEDCPMTGSEMTGLGFGLSLVDFSQCEAACETSGSCFTAFFYQ